MKNNIQSTGMIDIEFLSQFDALDSEGLPDIVIELIDSFLSTSPKRVEVIANQVSAQDISSTAREAHGLKSSAHTLGAKVLAEVCQELEDFSHENTFSAHFELFTKFQNIYQQSCEELKNIKTERLK